MRGFGGERADQRQDRSLEGVVPGGDDQDETERLADHVAAPWKRRERGAHALGLHPGSQLLPGELDLPEHHADLRREGLELRLAEVRTKGVEDVSLSLEE